jgi:hypothetical protein
MELNGVKHPQGVGSLRSKNIAGWDLEIMDGP